MRYSTTGSPHSGQSSNIGGLELEELGVASERTGLCLSMPLAPGDPLAAWNGNDARGRERA
jgi:hypothetical protein